MLQTNAKHIHTYSCMGSSVMKFIFLDYERKLELLGSKYTLSRGKYAHREYQDFGLSTGIVRSCDSSSVQECLEL